MTFDRERYERALKQHDEAVTEADYAAALCAIAEAQGRVPNPGNVARAEGRQATRAEWGVYYRRLGLDAVNGIVSPSVGASQRSRRSWHLDTRERSRPTAPSRPWDTESEADDSVREAPELEAAHFEIRLTAGVMRTIEQQVADAMWRFDRRDVESGGWLFAHDAPDAECVHLAYASGPGPEAEHGNGRVRLTDALKASLWLDDLSITSRLIRVGDWHSHPSDDPEPSDADLSAWQKNHRAADASQWVSLIVTPGPEMGWMAPRFHGYVTREDESGVLVCDPATVREP